MNVFVCVRRYLAAMHLISPTTKNCGRVKHFQYTARYEEDMKMEKRRERDPYIFTSSLPLSLCFNVCVCVCVRDEVNTNTQSFGVGVPVCRSWHATFFPPLHPFFYLPSFSLLPAFSPLAHSLKHTHTHTHKQKAQSDSLPRSHTNANEKMFLSSHFFLLAV